MLAGMTPRRPDSELPTVLADPTAAATEPVLLAGGALDDAGFTDRYQRGELLGRGGMGEVYLCRDARIGRRVALKQLRPGPAPTGGTGDRARFVREARIQAQLEHPAVVPVYEMGRTPDGGEFFTMKRVRGRTLADVLVELREGGAEAAARTSQRKLLTAFSSVCLAVQYAHERGVLHRDPPPRLHLAGRRHAGPLHAPAAAGPHRRAGAPPHACLAAQAPPAAGAVALLRARRRSCPARPRSGQGRWRARSRSWPPRTRSTGRSTRSRS
jgi:hypothetical protein